MAQDRHYALAREAILAALTAYTGITTADGATPANNTLICSALIGENDFISGKTVLIGSGDAVYEDKGAASFDDTTGSITVGSPFSAQIKAGTIFRILNVASGQVTELLDALVSYRGTTTADGAIGGGTLVCSDLTTKPDFDGNQVVIKSGPYAGQVRDILGVTTGGTVTPHTSFGGTITEGTRFSITAIRTVPAEVAAIDGKVSYTEDSVSDTTANAYADALDIDTRGMKSMSMELANTDGANSLTWRLRCRYADYTAGADEEIVEAAGEEELTFGTKGLATLLKAYSRIKVQVKSTVADSHATYTLTYLINR